MQNPIISNIWTVSHCVFEAVEGEKGRLKEPFKMGVAGLCLGRRAENSSKTDNHHQHLLWLLGHLALGHWHGQLDLLFALAHNDCPNSWQFPLVSHPLKGRFTL